MTDKSLALLDGLHKLMAQHPNPGDETNVDLGEFFSQYLAPYEDHEALEIVCKALSIESYALMQTAEKLRNLGN